MTNLETIMAMGGIGLTLAGLLFGASKHLGDKLDGMRKESQEGRREIYAKLDGLRDWVSKTFVPTSVYEAEKKGLEREMETMRQALHHEARIHAYHLGRNKGSAIHDDGPTD